MVVVGERKHVPFGMGRGIRLIGTLLAQSESSAERARKICYDHAKRELLTIPPPLSAMPTEDSREHSKLIRHSSSAKYSSSPLIHFVKYIQIHSDSKETKIYTPLTPRSSAMRRAAFSATASVVEYVFYVIVREAHHVWWNFTYCRDVRRRNREICKRDEGRRQAKGGFSVPATFRPSTP